MDKYLVNIELMTNSSVSRRSCHIMKTFGSCHLIMNRIAMVIVTVSMGRYFTRCLKWTSSTNVHISSPCHAFFAKS